MKRSEATNTFNEGMVMDFNPLVTPDNVVVNALNGTIITRNGNENVLQNDMGNGRVETACLPEGYIPLGTTSLGGIIYIVSYNPLTNKCQIGSFPSPERNVTTDELESTWKVLSNESDFQFTKTEGAKSTYIKKIFTELKFNPGDLFIIYGNSISYNIEKLFPIDNNYVNNFDRLKTQAVKISIGALSDNGKLTIFNNLKEYSINREDQQKEFYHISEYNGESSETPFNVDNYRSLLSQPYNVYQSKISGKIVLICELVQPSGFDVSVLHTIKEEGNKSTYYPELKGTLTSEYQIAPKGIYCKATLEKPESDQIIESETYIDFDYNDSSNINDINRETPFTQYEFNVQSIIGDEVVNTLQDFDFSSDQEGNAEGILTLEIIPYMNWGLVTYLAKSITVDLARINTGFINLIEWRYYNQNNTVTLNWGLECYEKQNETITGVNMIFSYLEGNEKKQFVYSVSKQESYHGKFIEKFDITNDSQELINGLKPNNLYLVEISIEIEPERPKQKKFYRWLYTSPVFNDYYTSKDDFNDLSLPIQFEALSNFTPIINKEQEEISNGNYFYKAGDPVQDVETLSYIKNNYKISGTIETQIVLKDNYNIFDLSYESNTITISKKDPAVNVSNIISGNNANSNLYLGASIGDTDTGISINLGTFPSGNGLFTLQYDNSTYTGTYYYNDNSLRLFQIPFYLKINQPQIEINGSTLTMIFNNGSLILNRLESQEDYPIKVLNPSYVITSGIQIQDLGFSSNILSSAFNMSLDEYIKAFCNVKLQEITFDLVYKPLVSVSNYLDKGFYIDADRNLIYIKNIIAYSSGDHGPFTVRFCDLNVDEHQYSITRYDLTKADDDSYGFLDNANNYRTSMLSHNVPDITLFVHVLHHDSLYKWKKGPRLSYGLDGNTSDDSYKNNMDYKVCLGIKAPTGEPIPICYTCNFVQTADYPSLEEALINEVEKKEFQVFLKNIFCALNQLYYQDNNQTIEKYYVANEITFVDQQSLTVTIPIDVCLNDGMKPSLLINGRTLSDIANTLIHNIPEEIELHNTEYELLENKYNSQIFFTLSNDADGRTLRNNILNGSSARMRVYDFDGQTINQNAILYGNPGASKLFISSEDGELSSNFGFYPQRLSYDFKQKKAKIIRKDYLVDTGIQATRPSNYFSIKDGSIYITNPTNEYKFSFTSNKGPNQVSGFQLKYLGRGYIDCKEPVQGKSGLTQSYFKEDGFDKYEYTLDESSEKSGYIVDSFNKDGVDVFFNLIDSYNE